MGRARGRGGRGANGDGGPGLTIGSRIERARANSGLSKAELARRMDIDSRTLYSWTADTTVPSIPTLRALAELLGVSFEWLVTGYDPHELERLGVAGTFRRIEQQLAALADELRRP